MFNLLSHAKLNLSLEVNSLLDNGFHNLTSIMHTLHLHDEISISHSKNTKTVFIPSTVEGSNNSILDAVHLFQQEFHIPDQVEIVTTKNIPTSSGLGGGSSNSTAVLKELIKINKLEVELSKQRELAFQLSSDSPFFVSGGCSLVEGQGEKITTGLGINNLWSIIFTPLNIEISNKTRFMYSLLSKQHYSDGSITAEIFNSINHCLFMFLDRKGFLHRKIIVYTDIVSFRTFSTGSFIPRIRQIMDLHNSFPISNRFSCQLVIR